MHLVSSARSRNSESIPVHISSRWRKRRSFTGRGWDIRRWRDALVPASKVSVAAAHRRDANARLEAALQGHSCRAASAAVIGALKIVAGQPGGWRRYGGFYNLIGAEVQGAAMIELRMVKSREARQSRVSAFPGPAALVEGGLLDQFDGLVPEAAVAAMGALLGAMAVEMGVGEPEIRQRGLFACLSSLAEDHRGVDGGEIVL